MPVLAIVRFPLPEGVTLESAREKFAQSTARYAGVPGLIRKNYMLAKDRTHGGAVYLFEDDAAAARVHDDAWVQQIRDRFGVAPQVEYLDCPVVVDNDKGDVQLY